MGPLRSLLLAVSALTLLSCKTLMGPSPEAYFAPRLDQIAFASCSVQFLPQDHWGLILKEEPDLFIFGGDNVYGDLKVENGRPSYGEGSPELLAANYAMLGNLPKFKAFREAMTILPIWDDHDFGQNGGGATYEHREDAERQFLDFWNVPAGDPRRGRPGIYTADIYGPIGERVQIIRLDTRFFRSDILGEVDPATGRERNVPDPDPAKTMLGADQWTWLAKQLEQKADVRLIVSSVQIEATTHPYEKWQNLPLERDRLFTLIAETKANGVVFLSGDRHNAGIYARRENVSYPIFEMTSSSLNYAFPPSKETDPLLLGEIFFDPNYSTLTFDWEARTLILEVKNMKGETVRAAGLEIDSLK